MGKVSRKGKEEGRRRERKRKRYMFTFILIICCNILYGEKAITRATVDKIIQEQSIIILSTAQFLKKEFFYFLVAFAQVDWHDFVVVETVNFREDEIGKCFVTFSFHSRPVSGIFYCFRSPYFA